MTDAPVEKQCNQHGRGTISHVAEHQPEEEWVSEENEQSRIDLAVTWTSHQVGDEFHRLGLVTISELDWREFDLGVVKAMSSTSGSDFERLDIDVEAGL